MKNLENVYLKMENANLRQRFVIITANFLLWLIINVFKHDEKKMQEEIKDVIINAYKVL